MLNKLEKESLLINCINLPCSNSIEDDKNCFRYFLKLLDCIYTEDVQKSTLIEKWIINSKYESYRRTEFRYKFKFLINKMYFEDVELNSWNVESFKDFNVKDILNE